MKLSVVVAPKAVKDSQCKFALREHKLRCRAEFLHCYDKGRRYFSTRFVLFAAPRADAALPWRLGMAVTKKCGSAVRRNRVRRLVRESFRLMQGSIADGYDYVVVPKRGIDSRSLTFALVSAELGPLLGAAARGKVKRVRS